MTNNLADLSISVLPWLATYLVHSTLLLGAAWLVTRFIGRRGFAIQDQIWKLAMVLPLLTASIQQAVGPSSLALTQWTLAWPEEKTVATNDPPARVARPDQRDGRGPQRETVVSGIPREQPIDIPKFDAESSPIPAAPETLNTPTVSTPENDWTIDIRPGPAVDLMPEWSVLIPEAPNSASADPAVVPTDEEKGRGGDEETTPAASPPAFSSSPHPPLPSSQPPWLLIAVSALIALHLTFAACRLLILVWREQRLLRVMVSGNDGPARGVLDQILASRGIRGPVQLLYTGNVRGPAACGWRRWRIILPAGLDHEMPQDELRALLAHELAHLVRRDTIWMWSCRALCIVLPLQPLNFVARRRWEETAEYLCDAWAVDANVAPLTMAKCLTRVADRYLGGPAPVGLTAVGRQSTLSRRVERLTAGRISNPSHGRAGRLLVVLLAFSVAAATVIAAPRVVLQGESVPTVALPDESNLPRERRDEGMRSTGDGGLEEVIISPTGVDAQSELRHELRTLLADLDRLNELLAGVDDSPELSAAREQMHQRLERIRGRLAEESQP